MGGLSKGEKNGFLIAWKGLKSSRRQVFAKRGCRSCWWTDGRIAWWWQDSCSRWWSGHEAATTLHRQARRESRNAKRNWNDRGERPAMNMGWRGWYLKDWLDWRGEESVPPERNSEKGFSTGPTPAGVSLRNLVLMVPSSHCSDRRNTCSKASRKSLSAGSFGRDGWMMLLHGSWSDHQQSIAEVGAQLLLLLYQVVRCHSSWSNSASSYFYSEASILLSPSKTAWFIPTDHSVKVICVLSSVLLSSVHCAHRPPKLQVSRVAQGRWVNPAVRVHCSHSSSALRVYSSHLPTIPASASKPSTALRRRRLSFVFL